MEIEYSGNPMEGFNFEPGCNSIFCMWHDRHNFGELACFFVFLLIRLKVAHVEVDVVES